MTNVNQQCTVDVHVKLTLFARDTWNLYPLFALPITPCSPYLLPLFALPVTQGKRPFALCHHARLYPSARFRLWSSVGNAGVSFFAILVNRVNVNAIVIV